MSAEHAPTWSPKSLDDALSLLAEHDDTTVIAGGTDLMVYVQARMQRPTSIINIWGLDALRGVARDGDDLVIGALTTFSSIIDSPLVQAGSPSLVDAAKTVGARQIQNRATLGGNIANASPAADSPPALLAADAQLDLVSQSGTRRVALRDFFRGYKDMDLRAGELIAAVRLPMLKANQRDWFVKVGTRRAQSISKVVMAGRATLDGGFITAAALSVGSVAATTIRLPNTEAVLTGAQLGPETEAAARVAAAAEVTPIDDIRSTRDYRAAVSGNMAARFARYLASVR